ncbi:hypothetical protein SCOCK_210064 [Actinacidiphila cocklensis]|uniref:Uncharacterized protein n=1 Tax=Actinacidiphila cocklensis TaxID=887465 RepID=A0A9W4E5F3_9ACTN|nr:hypothetical protein SCOCK_210064 [Actinacidiphila cocklensis]
MSPAMERANRSACVTRKEDTSAEANANPGGRRRGRGSGRDAGGVRQQRLHGDRGLQNHHLLVDLEQGRTAAAGHPAGHRLLHQGDRHQGPGAVLRPAGDEAGRHGQQHLEGPRPGRRLLGEPALRRQLRCPAGRGRRLRPQRTGRVEDGRAGHTAGLGQVPQGRQGAVRAGAVPDAGHVAVVQRQDDAEDRRHTAQDVRRTARHVREGRGARHGVRGGRRDDPRLQRLLAHAAGQPLPGPGVDPEGCGRQDRPDLEGPEVPGRGAGAGEARQGEGEHAVRLPGQQAAGRPAGVVAEQGAVPAHGQLGRVRHEELRGLRLRLRLGHLPQRAERADVGRQPVGGLRHHQEGQEPGRRAEVHRVLHEQEVDERALVQGGRHTLAARRPRPGDARLGAEAAGRRPGGHQIPRRRSVDLPQLLDERLRRRRRPAVLRRDESGEVRRQARVVEQELLGLPQLTLTFVSRPPRVAAARSPRDESVPSPFQATGAEP